MQLLCVCCVFFFFPQGNPVFCKRLLSVDELCGRQFYVLLLRCREAAWSVLCGGGTAELVIIKFSKLNKCPVCCSEL